MKSKFVRLLNWANSHPVCATLISAPFFFSIPFTISSNEKLSENPYAWAIGGGVAFILGLVLCIALWRSSKKVVTLLLVTVMICAPIQHARSAAIGVGVVVLCVVGVCTYKVVKFCQKHLPPKSTNAPPEEFTAAGSEYGGACEYSAMGSCYVMPSLVNPNENLLINPTTFTLNIMVEPVGLSVSMSSNNDEGTTQTWDQFRSEMAEHGLFLTGHPSSQAQYELGGVPCDPSMVPLEFDPFTGRVTHHTGGEIRHVTVERSIDLQAWSPLLQTDTGVGSGFKVVDTTREGQMFYRVSLQ